MYDSATSILIRSAPHVGGIDPDRLPELLTRCYAEISMVRLRAADGSAEARAELVESVNALRALAMGLEIYAALGEEKEDRDSAAFVAGTAHQLLVQARGMLSQEARLSSRLEADSVPAEVAGALLFLAAGYPADAAEAVSRLPSPDDSDPRTPLLRSLVDLCRGNLQSARSRTIGLPEDAPLEERAELLLWIDILKAVRFLAARLQGSAPRDEAITRANQLLEGVQRAAVSALTFPAGLGIEGSAFSAFSGPHHLATLLLAAAKGLDGRALTDVPSPAGPPEDQWRNFIQRRVAHRPFLWTNHKDAIEAGLLNEGISATISFPTGAGKSTLSELKIAATALSGQKVLYLAPTRALVSQVSKNLRDLLSDTTVDEDEVEDQLFSIPDAALEKLVSVMTPERCLLLLTLFPDSFEDVKLVIFDECHFLHMPRDSVSARPISAMLSLLRLLELAGSADVLLMSAMMSNGNELAGWLQQTFGKETLCFDAAWKPTRQARGSIVFRRAEIDAATNLVPPNHGRIPQSRLQAYPHALVSLQQTWASNSINDYKVLPLIDSLTRLKGSRTWNGTPRVDLDTSACAVAVALKGAERGLKTIVFFHNPSSIEPALRAALTEAQGDFLNLDPDEDAFFRAASVELGGDDHVFVPNKIAGGHYGDLIREERELVEGAFKRRDGIRVLFSTNTLAQGMNLPADLVVIVRTGAYNAEAGAYQNIEVHDLLNAAGRAGRAGFSANGMVLVIPDRIVTFNLQNQVSGTNLRHLKDGVLAQDDRCLSIADPIEVVLDALAAGQNIDERLLNYLLLRLPPRTENETARERSDRFFARSLGAYRASVNADENFAAKVQRALSRREDLIPEATPIATEAMCSATGLSPDLVTLITRSLEEPELELHQLSALGWSRWVLALLDANPAHAEQLLRSAGGRTSAVLSRCTEMWLTGAAFREIELTLGTEPQRLGHLRKARKFCRDFVGELSFSVGLVAQIAAETIPENGQRISDAAQTAAMLIRDGYDTREKWALGKLKRQDLWTRVRVHSEAERWLRYVEPAQEGQESVTGLLQRVGRGIREFQNRAAGG